MRRTAIDDPQTTAHAKGQPATSPTTLSLRVRDEPESLPLRTATKPPLLCVHGAGMSSVFYLDLIRRLTPLRRVIAPDLPGHGQSSLGRQALDVAGQCDVVKQLADRLVFAQAGRSQTQPPAVVLVGHSLGAAVALSFASRWPQQVAGLILLNAAPALALPDEILQQVVQALWPQSAPMTEADRHADRSRYEGLPAPLAELLFATDCPSERRARWSAMLWAGERRAIYADFRLCQGVDLRDQLARIEAPALCIGGQEDLLVAPSQTVALGDALPRSTSRVLPGTGHLTLLEDPDATLEAIEQFLTKIGC